MGVASCIAEEQELTEEAFSVKLKPINFSLLGPTIGPNFRFLEQHQIKLITLAHFTREACK